MCQIERASWSFGDSSTTFRMRCREVSAGGPHLSVPPLKRVGGGVRIFYLPLGMRTAPNLQTETRRRMRADAYGSSVVVAASIRAEIYGLGAAKFCSSPKTLVFYRDRPVGGVAWAWLCGAVTIEPFEVSLWRGGCGGLLWDFNHAGSLAQSRRGCLRAGAATLRGGWDCERSVRCGA